MTAWTHYWKRRTAEAPRSGPLDHTASNRFRSRGVKKGDTIYVISFWDGTLRILGRLDVDLIVDQAQAERIRGEDLWPAYDHVLAKPGSATMFGSSVVPDLDLAKVEFMKADGTTVGVTYKREGKVEPQSFRSEVREITKKTARLFDQLLR